MRPSCPRHTEGGKATYTVLTTVPSIGQIPPTELETLHYAGLGPEDQPTLEAAQNLG